MPRWDNNNTSTTNNTASINNPGISHLATNNVHPQNYDQVGNNGQQSSSSNARNTGYNNSRNPESSPHVNSMHQSSVISASGSSNREQIPSSNNHSRLGSHRVGSSLQSIPLTPAAERQNPIEHLTEFDREMIEFG